MHQTFHAARQTIGWCVGGEILFQLKSRCRIGAGDSGRNPGNPPRTRRATVPEHVDDLLLQSLQHL